MSPVAKKDVPTMHCTGTLRFLKTEALKALELRYLGGSLSMLFILPDAVDGLTAIEESLTARKLDAIVNSLSPARVTVALPKFEVGPSDSLSLRNILTAMGMGTAFDRQRADFSGISNPPDPADRLYLDSAFHKCLVRVDEEGTEAAAATAVSVTLAAVGRTPAAEFKADHPFLFFIRDNATGLVVFLGRLTDPPVNLKRRWSLETWFQ
jgi:serpin B